MLKNIKTYLTGRDFVNWATDDDFFFIKEAISYFLNITEDIHEADIIHSINWFSLLPIDLDILKHKKVISHIPHDVRHMLSQPKYLKILPYVDCWIVPSLKANKYIEKLSLPHEYVPYGIRNSDFFHIKGLKAIAELKDKYNVPHGKYLIGSFQRDTEGADLSTPKYIKGPDLFLEIVRKVYQTNKNIHIVLAGPRRFWLRKKLLKADIPFTYIGQAIKNKDDLIENTLDKKTVNKLYNILDLYIVSSRMEGGPKAILECTSSQTKIISTDVGNAVDILNRKQIYSNFIEASNIIIDDIESNVLSKYSDQNIEKISANTIEHISKLLFNIYKNIDRKLDQPVNIIAKKIKPHKRVYWRNLFRKKGDKKLTIHHQFHPPPWGGGNQFLLALSSMLEKKSWVVTHSRKKTKGTILFNSFLIDFNLINKIKSDYALMLHRIDGPTYLIRGEDKEIDDDIFNLNNKIADISIFQSIWSLFATLSMGYKPVNPVLIMNASSPDIFNRKNKPQFKRDRKTKLISSSWSDNPRKGGRVYKWLDENLNWDKYEYTFAGRVQEKLDNIKIIDPVPSEELSSILKQHDIFITASDNDPCSNAVIEALSCGLPVIYLDKGGHSELVQFGGLGFKSKEEIPDLLDLLVRNYTSFINLVVAPDMDSISEKYTKTIELGL